MAIDLMALSKLIPFLPTHFARTHRSYIVNLRRIRQIEGNKLDLGTTEIPIGKSYRDDFHEKLKIIN